MSYKFNRKRTLQELQEKYKSKGFEFIDKYENYKNVNSILKCRCLKHKKILSFPLSYLNHKFSKCPECKQEKLDLYYKRKQRLESFCKERNWNCLNPEMFKNINSNLRFLCNKHQIEFTASFVSGRCPKCKKELRRKTNIQSGKKRRVPISEINKRWVSEKSWEVLKRDDRGSIEVFCKKHQYKWITTLSNYKGCYYCVHGYQKGLGKISELELRRRAQKRNLELLSPYSEYKDQNSRLKFKCIDHNFIFIAKSDYATCPKCYLQNKYKIQLEIFDFIKSNLNNTSIIWNDRKILNGKELDIFVPKYNFAVECNGWMAHSSFNEKLPRNFHLEKSKQCSEKGIVLFHIFTDEWKKKKEIIKSMIRYQLGIIKKKKYARNLKIVEDNPDVKNFLEENHINGYTYSKKSFSLVEDGTIFSVITLRHPFISKYKNTIEITRFCIKRNFLVNGAFGKLMKEVKIWTKNNGYKQILTYAGRQFGYLAGQVYHRNGFQCIGSTGINYFYITPGFEKRIHRWNVKKKNGKSELVIAEEKNLYKVNVCGSNIYIYYL